jgi:hypothetical protein
MMAANVLTEFVARGVWMPDDRGIAAVTPSLPPR